MRHFLKYLYYFPRMKGGKEGRKEKRRKNDYTITLGFKTLLILDFCAKWQVPFFKKKGCRVRFCQHPHSNVMYYLVSLGEGQGPWKVHTFQNQICYIQSQPYHVFALQFPKCGPGALWVLREPFQGTHEVNIIFIIMLICHVPFSPSSFS